MRGNVLEIRTEIRTVANRYVDMPGRWQFSGIQLPQPLPGSRLQPQFPKLVLRFLQALLDLLR